MTTYQITGPQFVAMVVVNDDGLICQADPVLDFALRIDWSHFVRAASKTGWHIQPLLEEQAHLAEVDVNGVRYEFQWVGKKCVRITKQEQGGEEEDVTVAELPEDIQEILE